MVEWILTLVVAWSYYAVQAASLLVVDVLATPVRSLVGSMVFDYLDSVLP